MEKNICEFAEDSINEPGSYKHPTSNIQIQSKSQISTNDQQNKPKIYDLRERLLAFSKKILLICKRIPRLPECDGIRRQLANAATAIGANFEEADGALTKKDFINKTGIARKEAKETKYWLTTISNIYISESELRPAINESEEIICILSAILFKSGYKGRY